MEKQFINSIWIYYCLGIGLYHTASGGIGVREFLITILLGSVVGTELVLMLSVIHRLITIIGDFLAYLVMLILRRKRK